MAKRKKGMGLGGLTNGMDVAGSKEWQAARSRGKTTKQTRVIDARRTGTEQIHPDSPGISPRRPVQTLDLHMDLLRWVTSQAARRQRAAWWDVYYGSGDKKARVVREGHFTADEVEEHVSAAGQYAYAEEVSMLSRATTIHVTPDMAELTHLLAESQPIRPLRSTDLWAPAGFIVLPDEWQLQYWTPDGENNTRIPMPIKAIAWNWGVVGRYVPDPNMPMGMNMVHAQGVKLWVYSTVPSVQAVYSMGHLTARDVSVLPLMDMSGWAVDSTWEEITESQRGLKLKNGPTVTSVSNEILGLDMEIDDSEDQELTISEDGSEVIVANPPYVSYLRKFVMAFWRLLDEEVAVVRPERVDRPAQKRAQRLGRIPNDGDVVRVVRLRRIVDIDSNEPMPLPEVAKRFTHRWRVKQFWRHLHRGMGLLEGDQLILDATWPWTRPDGGDVHLRLTDEEGRWERVTIKSAVGGIITLQWKPNLKQGFVEVDRLALVREHTRGAQDGMLIERYDVVSVER